MPRSGLPLFLSHARWFLAFFLFASLSTAPAGARNPKPPKYPLRFHVLASDESHRTPRMSPGESVACDSVEDMLSSISPNPGGPISVIGISSDPCSLGASLVMGRLLDIQNEESFSGAGRGDLVSPPNGTLGISFQYKDCNRVRVHSGFQSLPARWKKPGQKLEVLIPSDNIPVGGRPLPPEKCAFTVTQHDFVYLLLPTGKIIEVSQDLYWAKPGLRVFLSGRTQTIQRRAQEVAVAAHPAQ